MWMQVDNEKAAALLAMNSDDPTIQYFQGRIRHYRDEGNVDVEAQFREAAEELSREGELEVDEEATVSIGADGHGAYVMAWWWISNEQAGFKTEEEDE